ncbi:nucleotide exchange factor GrpE, partial [Candidatus Woesearchaeota archaeon]|nr:nucleotide exchange factor GrpE [Candidatus Woesearchaeota archaeon]
KILPILDGFEQALKNKTTGEQFAQGMDMLFKEFHTVLEREGLKSISAIGKKFDPFEQEALSAEESEKEEGTVLEEFQKGYMFKEAVLRPAKVKISRQKKKEEQHENH